MTHGDPHRAFTFDSLARNTGMDKKMTDKPKRTSGAIDRLPGGRYRVRIRMADGTRISKGTFGTEPEAIARLDELIVDKNRVDLWDHRKGRKAFSAFVPDVLALRKTQLRPRPYANSVSLFNTTILPTFGSFAVADISPQSVDEWWAALSDHPANRRNAYFELRKALAYATKWGYIRSNPCMVEQPGRSAAKRRPRFTAKQFNAVMQRVDRFYRPALWVMFTGHLRLGEVIGLDASDYDRSTGFINVVKAADLNGRESETKTGQHKHITLLPQGIEAMDEYLARYPKIGAAPLFHGERAARMPRASLREAWNEACAAEGFEGFHLHDSRHVSLTLLRAAGADWETIKQRGGHASDSVASLYQDADEEHDAEIAAKAGALLKRRLER
ncbi:hypothetical protein BH11ACT2_BH11ACT2_23210 [soil metagenome]